MLPIKRRRNRQKERKAQQQAGISIPMPTGMPQLGGPQTPVLPRIMFRNRLETSFDEANATPTIKTASGNYHHLHIYIYI
jgi:hypothetical protein